MKKSSVTSQNLPKVQVLSKEGQVISESQAKVIDVQEPGSIIKLSIDKGQISGAKKVGDDLIIVNEAKQEITVKNFFNADGSEVNKIVLDDNGELYVSSYDSPFNGLNFAHADSMDAVVSDSAGSISWVAPVVGIAALGGVIAAVASNNSSDDSSDTTPSVDVNTLNATVAKITAQSTKIAASKQALLDAIAAMKAGSLEETVVTRIVKTNTLADDKTKVEKLELQLEADIADLNTFANELESLIAALKDIDTTQASALLVTAKATLAEVNEDITSAKAELKVASDIIEALDNEDILVKADKASDVKAKIEAAKSSPTDGNIEAAKTAVSEYSAYITKLEAAKQALIVAKESAETNGFISNATTKDITDAIAEIEAKIAEAKAVDTSTNSDLDALSLIDSAKVLIAEEKAAVEKASQDFETARAALAAAKAAMAEAVANNELSKIAEINKQIDEANALLDVAKQSQAAAEEAYIAAKHVVDKINDSGITPSVSQLDTLTPVEHDVEDLSAINSHLEVDSPESIWDVLCSFIDDSIASISNYFESLGETSLGKIVLDIVDTFEKTFDYIKEAVDASFKSIELACNAIKGVSSEAWSVVEKVFSDIICDPLNIISQAISDTIAEFFTFKWVISLDWFSSITQIFVDKFLDAFTSIPGKIIESLGETFGTDLPVSFSKSIEIIKTAFTEITEVLNKAFIQDGYDNIIKPIIDDICDFISDPIGSISETFSSIWQAFKDGFNITGDFLFKLPEAIVKALSELGSDVFDSIFGSDKVVIVDDVIKALGDEPLVTQDDQLISDSIDVVLDAQEGLVSDALAEDITNGFDDLISEDSANISLDNIEPVVDSLFSVDVEQLDTVTDLVASLAQTVVSQEDDYSAVIAA